MKSHPAADIFPMLDGAGLAELAADIRRNGQRHPIVRIDGQILDGRNRYQACLLAEREPQFVEWDGKGTPLEYVWSVNGPRRHLSPDQRAWIALESLPLLEAEASSRKKAGKTIASAEAKVPEAAAVAPADKRAPFGATPRGKAAQLAADAAGCSRALVERAKRIRDTAHPKVHEAVKHGEIAIGDAAAVLAEPLEAQKAALDAVLKAVRAKASKTPIAGAPLTLAAYVRGLHSGDSDGGGNGPGRPPAAPHVDLPALADGMEARNALEAIAALGERPEVTSVVTGEGYVVITVTRAAAAPLGALVPVHAESGRAVTLVPGADVDLGSATPEEFQRSLRKHVAKARARDGEGAMDGLMIKHFREDGE